MKMMEAAMDVMRELPAGWRWVRLGECATYYNGRAFKPEEWREEGTPIIRIENLNSCEAKFNYFQGETLGCHQINDGDLLVSWSASLDAYIWRRGQAVLNQHIFKVEENPELVQRNYLYLVLRHTMADIRERVHGATMQHITKPEFERIVVPLPPLPEQRRITVVLEEQMAAVKKARAACEARLEAARALPSAVLTSVFESMEANSWIVRRLGDVLIPHKEIIHPGDRTDGTAEFVGLEHVESHTGERIGSMTLDLAHLSGRKPTFRRGQIVYGYLRPYLNKVWIAEFDGCSSVDQFAYDVRDHIADVRFVAWFLRSPTYLRRSRVLTTTGQLPRIGTAEIAAVPIGIPPLEKQRTICAQIEDCFTAGKRLRNALQVEAEAMATLPAALLRQAFNGEI